MTYNKKVIDFPEPEVWTFADCEVSGSGHRPLEEWYQKKLSEEGRFEFDSLLKVNHRTKSHRQWVGWRGFLKGKADAFKIWEVGFKADSRQYRVFGIFGRLRRQAILLGGCYHKMAIYCPPNAIGSACKLAREVKEGRVDFHVREIRTDI